VLFLEFRGLESDLSVFTLSNRDLKVAPTNLCRFHRLVLLLVLGEESSKILLSYVSMSLPDVIRKVSTDLMLSLSAFWQWFFC